MEAWWVVEVFFFQRAIKSEVKAQRLNELPSLYCDKSTIWPL